jgi:hypothetical protein
VDNIGIEISNHGAKPKVIVNEELRPITPAQFIMGHVFRLEKPLKFSASRRNGNRTTEPTLNNRDINCDVCDPVPDIPNVF